MPLEDIINKHSARIGQAMESPSEVAVQPQQEEKPQTEAERLLSLGYDPSKYSFDPAAGDSVVDQILRATAAAKPRIPDDRKLKNARVLKEIGHAMKILSRMYEPVAQEPIARPANKQKLSNIARQDLLRVLSAHSSKKAKNKGANRHRMQDPFGGMFD